MGPHTDLLSTKKKDSVDEGNGYQQEGVQVSEYWRQSLTKSYIMSLRDLESRKQ